MKYARASRVQVRLTERDGMADRAHALGGTFAVESEPGAGCRITVRIPAGRN
ncbi:MAG TPA: hypothetical protein VD969_05485 [Symbiobacteriaceae bacterium]|nr:hypothetical protein [Symbiobacteriaceae bacterium]